MEIILNTTGSGLQTKNISSNYLPDVVRFNRYLAGRAVTPETIQDYFKQVKKDGLSLSSINKYKAGIKHALLLSFGQNITLAERSQVDTLFQSIKAKKPKYIITKEMTLTPQEVHLLIRYAGIKTGLIIDALYQTAARVSELVNIKLSDCQIRPQGVVITATGKGDKKIEFFMTVELFKRIKEVYESKVYLFQNTTDGHINRKAVFTMIRKAGKNIDRSDISPHTLRHSWATNALPIVGLSAVSNYLHHNSPSTTARYYLHGKASLTDIMACNVLINKPEDPNS